MALSLEDITPTYAELQVIDWAEKFPIDMELAKHSGFDKYIRIEVPIVHNTPDALRRIKAELNHRYKAAGWWKVRWIAGQTPLSVDFIFEQE